jgi:hypothetical protein
VERQGARDVHPVDESFVEHEPGAVVALLARLEHQQDVARELVASLDQQASGTEQHRDVRVVPAGVHRTIDLGREVEPGVLAEGQGVHVGPEQGRRAGPGAVDRRGDRRRGTPEPRIQSENLQRLDHDRLRLWQLQPDLRTAMEAAPHLDHVRQDRLAGGQQRCESVRGGRVGHALRVLPGRVGRHGVIRPSLAVIVVR